MKELNNLVKRLRDARNTFLFDPNVSDVGWTLLNDAANAIEQLTNQHGPHLRLSHSFLDHERIVGLCSYRDKIFVATDHSLYRIDNAHDPTEITLHILKHLREGDLW